MEGARPGRPESRIQRSLEICLFFDSAAFSLGKIVFFWRGYAIPGIFLAKSIDVPKAFHMFSSDLLIFLWLVDNRMRKH